MAGARAAAAAVLDGQQTAPDHDTVIAGLADADAEVAASLDPDVWWRYWQQGWDHVMVWEDGQ
ncbi:hypothetical protein [Mycobacterium sp.]|uniref:hypothetical protein n=1 Tax=Mycobacterium sp. TaxID=1785 RepID=UPI0031E371D0